MADVEPQPRHPLHRIGSILAAMLTVAIVVVVFWQNRPAEHPAPTTAESSDSGGGGFSGGGGWGGGGFGRFGRVPDGIVDDSEGNYRVISGPVMVTITGSPEVYEYRMRMYQVMDEDARAMARTIRRLNEDPGLSRTIGLSAEQMEQVRLLQPSRMVVSDADQARFGRLWADWKSSSGDLRDNAKRAVLDALQELGKKSIEPTKTAWRNAGDELKKILTPQQIARLAVYEQGGSPLGLDTPPVVPLPSQTR